MATTIEVPVRPELLNASDEVIEDAVNRADVMVLRGLIYQLTGDQELVDVGLKTISAGGFFVGRGPATDADTALIRRKAIEFLKAYRDSGAGEIGFGPPERLATSIRMMFDEPLPDADMGMYIEELALDHWARALDWQREPSPEQLRDFTVTIIGAGMGGLNAAVHLKRAGIPYLHVEKNDGVGGTWYENRYPGARVDTPSRSYTHLYGVDFGYPNPYCPWNENTKYFDWVADNFGVRDDIQFNTEVRSLTWDDDAAMWEVRLRGPDGERVHRSRAVITAVGFLNRLNMPEIAGMDEFAGLSWHTSRWPADMDLSGKRVAVIGTGATGTQMIPQLALEAGHVTVFQRRPQWLVPIPGYLSPFPPQIGWLDRNLPFHTNFMRARAAYRGFFEDVPKVDPNFDDPHACGPANKRVRDALVAFIEKKLDDPELIATMTPPHPFFSARPIIVDTEYCILDAIQRDNVTLVTDGIRRINRNGVEDEYGVQHDVDVIVYATGFRATEYLYPMAITGRDGKTVEALWEEGGARAYLGCMLPGFPNLWSIYGPNTNGGLNVATFHEMITHYAMQCMERLILNRERSVEVREEPYWRYNRLVDEENSQRVWSDPRAQNYYWTRHGRSATQNPFDGPDMWRWLKKPDFGDMEIR